MRACVVLMILLGLGSLAGCGGAKPVDTTKSVAPKTPDELKADIEKAMKEKGMTTEDYGKPSK